MDQETREVKVLHKSMLLEYKDCPRRFFYDYVLKQRPPSTVGGMAWQTREGIVFHRFAKAFFEKAPDEPGSLEELLALIPSGIRGSLRGMMVWFVESEWRRLRSGVYRWKPVLMEKRVEGVIEDARFAGTVDRVDEIAPGEYAVIEYKTSGSLHLSDWRLELWIYAEMLRQNGYTVTKHYVVNPRRQEILELRVDNRTGNRVRKLVRRILGDKTYQPKPGDHCVYCPYIGVCEAWTGRLESW